MAQIEDFEADDFKAVADETAFRYEFGGQSVRICDPGDLGIKIRGRAVVVDDLRRVELVFAEGLRNRSQDALATIFPDLHELTSSGWEVRVLAHQSELGLAHHLLRGLVSSVQGWWRTSSASIAFSRPEVA
jgi:hypothetical protein